MMRNLAIVVLIGGLVAPALQLHAEEPAAPTPAPEGRWWDRNANSISPPVDALLLHHEGSFAFSDYSGNTHGSSYSLSGLFVQRKHQFSNYLRAGLLRQDVTYGALGYESGRTDTRTLTVSDHVRYDVGAISYLALGGEHYSDTITYIDARNSIFAGAGAIVEPSPTLVLDFFAGYGYTDLEYDPTISALIGVPPHEYSDGILVRAYARWQVYQQAAISQDFTGMHYLDRELGERVTSTTSLDLAVSRHVSLVLSYIIKDEQNAVVTATGADELDTTFTIALKLSS
jgi:hypothetical protein